MILTAEAITKSFALPAGDKQTTGDRVEVLRGVSLQLQVAESLAILGRSGCGKSTLVSILAGLETPSSGCVQVASQDLSLLSHANLNTFRAQNLGIIFQQFHLLEQLTALENVMLPLQLNKKMQAKQLAEQALTRVGLASRQKHFPHQMSRGECQRVAIARVLVMRPPVILADEPTGSLDQKTGGEIIQLLFELIEQEQTALVMVTHDLGIAKLCDRQLHMDQGLLT